MTAMQRLEAMIETRHGHLILKCIDIECAVASYFSPRVNLIVPNISWGLLFYEVDLLVVTPAGYCYEVEIKTSRSDLKADLQKRHGHRSKKIRRLYFAIPDYMLKDIEFVPERAGILVVTSRDILNGRDLRCKCMREPQTNTEARKLDDSERYQVARLGTMRIWSLKDTIMRNIYSDNYSAAKDGSDD